MQSECETKITKQKKRTKAEKRLNESAGAGIKKSTHAPATPPISTPPTGSHLGPRPVEHVPATAVQLESKPVQSKATTSRNHSILHKDGNIAMCPHVVDISRDMTKPTK